MGKFFWQKKNMTSASATGAAASCAQNAHTVVTSDAILLASLFVMCTIVSVISIRLLVWVLAIVLVQTKMPFVQNGK